MYATNCPTYLDTCPLRRKKGASIKLYRSISQYYGTGFNTLLIKPGIVHFNSIAVFLCLSIEQLSENVSPSKKYLDPPVILGSGGGFITTEKHAMFEYQYQSNILS